ncbi:MAG: hypothetical protein A3C90_04440 [Candidatus Magasanikbacteria bacterium RIFCSPHIGHO2_02_FULL_51_14]|uniref:Uncharacterized protein n=1 Tax=Candidatus Magasanikbacteria bacterium RIFCSPHIGHO2_02_FULL_51_14 TaxID=1798683 RepID=A0A1F6MQ29_9BACT|nr:MAG: hypothetical protein A3C90_04440 [Candidatus Magasanikbacteria bacterium RIFCSPHIGHO2_02_FULL_51_14]
MTTPATTPRLIRCQPAPVVAFEQWLAGHPNSSREDFFNIQYPQFGSFQRILYTIVRYIDI